MAKISTVHCRSIRSKLENTQTISGKLKEFWLLNRFPLLEESQQIFSNWLELVTVNGVIGKRTHDIRIVATMLACEITHLLTFNPSDFAVTSSITIVRPQDLVIAKADES